MIPPGIRTSSSSKTTSSPQRQSSRTLFFLLLISSQTGESGDTRRLCACAHETLGQVENAPRQSAQGGHCCGPESNSRSVTNSRHKPPATIALDLALEKQAQGQPRRPRRVPPCRAEGGSVGRALQPGADIRFKNSKGSSPFILTSLNSRFCEAARSLHDT